MGHTMSIHSRNDQVILEFGLKKPAFRIVANSPTTHGSIGLTTGLDPAMTLGCGGYGGNITSDNISPRHLLNIKRLAYEIAPAVSRFEKAERPERNRAQVPEPQRPGIAAAALTARIDDFLGTRGFRAGDGTRSQGPGPGGPAAATGRPGGPSKPAALDFVCEEDVRQAMLAGRQLVVSERAIVTPAARELGEANRVFAAPSWKD
jgi:acetaldehyde dehydrogenase (acetylating)